MNTSIKNRLFSLFLCIALMVSLLPATPISARAATTGIDLGSPVETSPGSGEYQYTGATVGTDDYFSVSIEVDSGFFTLASPMSGTFAGLDASAAYKTSYSATDELSYVVYTFASGTPANGPGLQAFLQDITFTPAAGVDQNVTVTADIVALTAGGHALTRFQDSYYAYVADSGITWQAAYVAAKALTFQTLEGYLTNITSLSEHNFIYNALGYNPSGNYGCFFGATRATPSAGFTWDDDDALTTWTATNLGADGTYVSNVPWYWAAGPEAGSCFGHQSGSVGNHDDVIFEDNTAEGGWSKWSTNEPNANAGTEAYGQYAYLRGGVYNWNDVDDDALAATDSHGITGYFVEFTPYDGTYTTQTMAVGTVPVTASATNYTITYNANGGTGGVASQIVEDGSLLTISSTVPTRDGYIFQGYSTLQNATIAAYVPGGAYPFEASDTLYAVWKADTYTAALYTDATTYYTSADVTYGGTTTLPVPTKDGYAFDGWYTASSGGTQVVASDGVPVASAAGYTDASGRWIITADTTLYAQWISEASGGITLGTPAETAAGSGVYKYTGATVEDGEYYSLSIEVDSGSFALDSTMTGTFADLNTSSTYTGLTSGDKIYIVYTFSSAKTAADLQAFIRDIAFTPAAATDQEVTATADIVALEDSGGHTLTRFQDSYYAMVDNGSALSWSAAYLDAKGLTFEGLAGYLTAITSDNEHNFIYNALGTPLANGGWFGATRSTPASGDWDGAATTWNALTTFTAGAPWYWACGPEAGTSFGTQGSPTFTTTTYSNWATSQPDAASNTEGFGQYAIPSSTNGEWNDLNDNIAANVLSYYVEFTAYEDATYGSQVMTSASIPVSDTATSYIITYDANGGTAGSVTKQIVAAGDSLTLTISTPAQPGYEFQGWSTDSSPTVAFYFPGSTYTFAGSDTLYAVWEEIPTTPTYTISWPTPGHYTLGGSMPLSVSSGDDITFTVIPATGYTDNAPLVAANGLALVPSSISGGVYYYTLGNITNDYNITVETISDETPTYHVAFRNNYVGAPALEYYSIDVVSDGTATITAFTDPGRDGYTFNGWNTADDGNGDPLAFGTTYIIADATYFAQWVPAVTGGGEYTADYTMTQVDGGITPASGDYVSISNRAELDFLAQYVNAGGSTTGVTFYLTNDIANYTFSSIGTTHDFNGVFDGCGYTVELNMSGTSNNYGLFTYNAGTIKNLTVTGTVTDTYTGSSPTVAAIAAWNTGVVENCSSLADVTATCGINNGLVGGVVGYNAGTGSVKNCYSNGTLTYDGTGTTPSVGGLAASNAGTVTNGYWSGTTLGVGANIGTMSGCSSFTLDGSGIGTLTTPVAVGSHAATSDLLTALNYWVTDQADAYYTWETDASVGPVFHALAANTVTLNGNGGSWSAGTAPYSINAADTLTLPDGTGDILLTGGSAAVVSLTRTGYTLIGWATNEARADAGVRDYVLGDTCAVTGDTTLYAVWTANTVASPITTGTMTNCSIAAATDLYDETTATAITAGSTNVPVGDTVHFAITPSTGYNISSVMVYKSDDTGTVITINDLGDGEYSFTMPAYGVTISAAAVATYTVSYAKGTEAAGYTVTPFESTSTVNSGDSFKFYVDTDPGYTLSGVTQTGGASMAVLNGLYTISNITANTAITVTVALATYTVSYSANGGTGSDGPDTKTYGADLALSDGGTIARTGYTLTGWSTSSTGPVEYGLGGIYTANANITLYAVWQADTSTVTMKFDASTTFATADVAYGSTTNLQVPSKAGYTFNGWYTATSGGTQVVSSTGAPAASAGTYVDSFGKWIITSDQTLYAQWTADTYNVYYPTSVAGATVGVGPANPVSYGDTVTVTITGASAVPSVLMNGVAVTMSTTDLGVTYTGTFAMPDEDAILTVNGSTVNTYVVTYTAGSGTGAPDSQLKVYGETLALSNVIPTRTGYTFAHWSGSDTNSYDPDDDYTANAALTLTAVWTVNQYTMTIPFGTGYSVTNTADPAVAIGATVNSPDTEYGDNYSFKVALSTGYDGTDMVVTANGAKLTPTLGVYSFTVTGDTAIAVSGVKPATYTITYTLGGGTIVTGAVYSYTYGTTTSLPTYVTRTGYTFLGWDGEDADTTEDTDQVISSTATGNKTYTAVWKQNTYTLTFEGGTGYSVSAVYGTAPGTAITSGTTDIPYGSLVTITVAASAGYDLSNMLVTANGVQLTKTTGSTSTSYVYKMYNFDENTIIEITDVVAIKTVTYNDDVAGVDIDVPQTQSVNSGDTVTLSGYYPTRSGYTFEGWATSSGTTTVAYLPGDTVTVTADVNLYAVWTAVTYTITYYTNAGTFSSNPTASYTIESTDITLPTTSTLSRTGYTFNGWYALSDFSGAVETTITAGSTGNKAFYAKWTAWTRAISYDDNITDTVTVPAAQTKTYGVDIVLSSLVPVRTGYAFKGWATTAGGAAAYQPGDTYAANPEAATDTATLFAVWQAETYTITYNTNGGALDNTEIKTFTIASGAVTLPTTTTDGSITRTGYTFGGWYTQSDFSGAAVTTIASGSTGSREFYAKWTAWTLAITYDKNAGSDAVTVPAGQTKTYGVDIVLSSLVPVRTGYVFLGWDANTDDTADYRPGDTFKAEPTSAAATLTLKAVWGTGSYKVIDGSDAALDVTNITYNYDTVSNGAVMENSTLVPVGSTVNFKITVNTGALDSVTVTYGATNTTLSYTYDEQTGVYSFTMPNGDVKITPVSKATSTVTLTASKGTGTAYDGEPITLYASVNVGATGTVTFYLGATVIGVSALDPVSGKATLQTSAAAGTYKADYSGDGNFLPGSGTLSYAVKSVTIDWDVSDTDDLSVVAAPHYTNNAYTLTMPAIYSTDATPELLHIGADYTVTWQKQVDGLWSDITTGSDASISVTAFETATNYRAIIRPAGNYSATTATDGLTLVTTVVGPFTKAPTTVALTPDSATYREGDTIEFTAAVTSTYGTVNEGYVRFTLPDGTTAVEPVSGGEAVYSWAVPSSITSTATTDFNFTADYLGTASYAANSDNSGLTLYTRTLKTGSITAGPLTVGAKTTIAVSGVTDMQGTGLTQDTHYTVTWYYSYNGGTYYPLTDADAGTPGMQVVPADTSYIYKAVIAPKSPYTSGTFELYVGCGTEADTSASLAVTHYTTIAAAPTTFAGQPLIVTATVTYQNAGVTTNVNGGLVYFYNGAGLIGCANVLNGKAILTVSDLPVGTCNIDAYYTGVDGVFKPIATGSITNVTPVITSATLASSGWTIYAEGGTGAYATAAAYTDTNKLVVGTTYELSVPDNVVSATINGNDYYYDYGTDYTLQWYVSKDGGYSWTYAASTEKLTVKPLDSTWQYRAIAMPKGNFTAPAAGVTADTDVKSLAAATSTTLAIVDSAGTSVSKIFEDQTITLNAAVTSAVTVGKGTVTFYKAASTYASIAAITASATPIASVDVDSSGKASVTVDSNAFTTAGTLVYYFAVYTAADTFAPSFNVDSVEPLSVTITYSGSPYITVSDGGGTVASITVGESYTLTAPDVYQLGYSTIGTDNALFCGIDYYNVWYYSNDAGTTWTAVGASSGQTLSNMSFDSDDGIYKVIAYPMGDYAMPVPGISTVTNVARATIDTTATLSIDGEFDTVGSVYFFPENTEIKLTAAVVKDGTTTPASGIVTFYRNTDGGIAEEIGRTSLDGVGKATITVSAEDVGPYEYYVVFETNDVYDTSSSAAATYTTNITIVPNEIAYNSDDITIKDKNDDPVSLATGLTVGKSYTLTAPTVYIKGYLGATPAFDNGSFSQNEAYYYKWQVSYDKGITWVTLEQTTHSITVIPESTDTQYRVTAYPVATTGFTLPVTGIISEKVETKNVASTKVDLELTNTISDSASTLAEYESQNVTLTATVYWDADEDGSVDDLLTSGIGGVNFYLYSFDGTTGSSVKVGYADLQANGTVEVTAAVPAYLFTTYNAKQYNYYYAEYVAGDAFAGSYSTTGGALSGNPVGIANTGIDYTTGCDEIQVRSTTAYTPVIQVTEGYMNASAIAHLTSAAILGGKYYASGSLVSANTRITSAEYAVLNATDKAYFACAAPSTFTSYTTYSAGLDILETSYTYTLTADTSTWPVTALDGEEINSSDFTLQWIRCEGNEETVVGTGSTLIVVAEDGVSYLLKVVPANNMTVGATSYAVRPKSDKTLVNGIDLIATESVDASTAPFDGLAAAYRINGSHEGDDITLTVKVTGKNGIAPTGYVDFTVLGVVYPVELIPMADGISASATYTIAGGIDIPDGSDTYNYKTNFSVSYRGDSIYSAATDAVTDYKIWSTELDTNSSAPLLVDSADFGKVMTATAYYEAGESGQLTLNDVLQYNNGLGWTDVTAAIAGQVASFTAPTASAQGSFKIDDAATYQFRVVLAVGNPMTVGKEYTLTLDYFYTEDGEKLDNLSDYYIEWQVSANAGLDYTVIASENISVLTMTVLPLTDTYAYRANIIPLTTSVSFDTAEYNITNAYKSNTAETAINVASETGYWLVYSDTACTTNMTGDIVTAVTDLAWTAIGGGIYQIATDKYVNTNAAPCYFQGNAVDLTATVNDVGDVVNGISGEVDFYYSTSNIPLPTKSLIAGATYIGTANLNTTVPGAFTATISVDDLPVAADGKKQDVYIYAIYRGDEANTDCYTVKSLPVTILSSVINATEYTATSDSAATTAFIYTASGAPHSAGYNVGHLYSDGTNTTLFVDNIITTLDGIKLTFDTDYSIAWEVASAYSGYTYNSIADETDMSTTVQPSDDSYFYRAVVVPKGSEKTVASKAASKNYRSNTIQAEDASVVMTVIPHNASGAALYAANDTVTVDLTVFGGGVPANGYVTLYLTDGSGSVIGDPSTTLANGAATFSYTLPANTVGEVTFYAVYESNAGYADETAEASINVRYKPSVSIDDQTVTYGTDYAIAPTVTGLADGAANTAAAGEVALTYYKDSAYTTPCGVPSDAGTYYVKAALNETAIYEGATDTAVLTIQKKTIEVSGITAIFQTKVFNGSTDTAANVIDFKLGAGVIEDNDAIVLNGTGVIDYSAVTNGNYIGTFGANVTGLTMTGADSANYTLSATTISNAGTVQVVRNEISVVVSGAAATSYSVYDAAGTAMSLGTASGKYKVTYYKYDGTGVKVVSSITSTGVYAVIVKPVDTVNYAGGNTATVKDGVYTWQDTTQKRGVTFAISGNHDIYGSSDGVTVTPSRTLAAGETYTVEYNGVTTVPSAVGTYLVEVVYGTETVAVGSYTIAKRAAAAPLTIAVPDSVYGESYTATITGTPSTDSGTVPYITYAGGTIAGVSYEKPTDVGTYIATLHVPTTATETAYEVSDKFTISQREIVVSAVNKENQQNTTLPVPEFTGYKSGDATTTAWVYDDRTTDLMISPILYVDIASRDVISTDTTTYIIRIIGGYDTNYKIVGRETGILTSNATDPKTPITAAGIPDGSLIYGDQIQLYAYGTKGYNADGLTTYSSSSTIKFEVSYNYEAPTGAQTVKTQVAAATWGEIGSGMFTVGDHVAGFDASSGSETVAIKITRGIGVDAVYNVVVLTAKRANVEFDFTDKDLTYNGADQSLAYAPDSSCLYLGTTPGTSTTDGNNAGVYVQVASVDDDDPYYKGSTGYELVIDKQPVTITAGTGGHTYGEVLDTTIPGSVVYDGAHVSTIAAIYDAAAVKKASDAGKYATYTYAGAVSENFAVTYVTDADGYTVGQAAALTTTSGVYSDYNAISAAVSRLYGENNETLGYSVASLVNGDNLADVSITPDTDGYVIRYYNVAATDANLKIDGHTSAGVQYVPVYTYNGTTYTAVAGTYILLGQAPASASQSPIVNGVALYQVNLNGGMTITGGVTNSTAIQYYAFNADNAITASSVFKVKVLGTLVNSSNYLGISVTEGAYDILQRNITLTYKNGYDVAYGTAEAGALDVVLSGITVGGDKLSTVLAHKLGDVITVAIDGTAVKSGAQYYKNSAACQLTGASTLTVGTVTYNAASVPVPAGTVISDTQKAALEAADQAAFGTTLPYYSSPYKNTTSDIGLTQDGITPAYNYAITAYSNGVANDKTNYTEAPTVVQVVLDKVKIVVSASTTGFTATVNKYTTDVTTGLPVLVGPATGLASSMNFKVIDLNNNNADVTSTYFSGISAITESAPVKTAVKAAAGYYVLNTDVTGASQYISLYTFDGTNYTVTDYKVLRTDAAALTPSATAYTAVTANTLNLYEDVSSLGWYVRPADIASTDLYYAVYSDSACTVRTGYYVAKADITTVNATTGAITGGANAALYSNITSTYSCTYTTHDLPSSYNFRVVIEIAGYDIILK